MCMGSPLLQNCSPCSALPHSTPCHPLCCPLPPQAAPRRDPKPCDAPQHPMLCSMVAPSHLCSALQHLTANPPHCSASSLQCPIAPHSPPQPLALPRAPRSQLAAPQPVPRSCLTPPRLGTGAVPPATRPSRGHGCWRWAGASAPAAQCPREGHGGGRGRADASPPRGSRRRLPSRGEHIRVSASPEQSRPDMLLIEPNAH